MHTVFIGIGSNLGNRSKNCREAINQLATCPHIKNLVKSKACKSKALTKGDPDYINAVVKFETELKPKELLRLVQRIEKKLGRVRTDKKWESRTIDLDILFYDDLIVKEPDLIIPHPELHKRIFVLKPLCDIDPCWIHPVLKKTVKWLLEHKHRRQNENIHRQCGH